MGFPREEAQQKIYVPNILMMIKKADLLAAHKAATHDKRPLDKSGKKSIVRTY